MVKDQTEAAIQIIWLINPDLKPSLHEPEELFQTEEPALIIKLNIMIVVGREIQKKIHHVPIGVIILQPTVQMMAHAGVILHHQPEGKTPHQVGVKIIRAVR